MSQPQQRNNNRRPPQRPQQRRSPQSRTTQTRSAARSSPSANTPRRSTNNWQSRTTANRRRKRRLTDENKRWIFFCALLVVVVVVIVLIATQTDLFRSSKGEPMQEAGAENSGTIGDEANFDNDVTDANGNPIYIPGNFVTDADGNAVTDENGVAQTEPLHPTETSSEPDIGNVVPTTEDTRPQSDDGRIIVDLDREDWYFTVVNHSRQIPDGYVPQLTYILTSIYGNTYQLDYRVAPHYEEMYYAAKKDGITLTPYSAYRSYDRQKRNYENRAADEHAKGLSWDEAYAEAAKVILPPGTSEHNLGFAMDVCNVYNSFANQPEYAWLMEHAHEYGFILRYTAEKQPVTGIVPEPWHWRYVGVENAAKIKESGLCLEEWLDQQGIPY